MKRLVFCFDGTWNALGADNPTNVVLAAASIVRETSNNVTQIIHYDEGVGTGRLEKMSGGILGAGLTYNIREAYRFLIFNYDPDDEIFVFGFSRGAFSARFLLSALFAMRVHCIACMRDVSTRQLGFINKGRVASRDQVIECERSEQPTQIKYALDQRTTSIDVEMCRVTSPATLHC